MSTRKVKVTDSELTKHFTAILFEEVQCDCEEKQPLNEDLTPSEKNEVKTIVRNEIRDFLKMARNESFDTMVKNMVKNHVKSDKDLEKHYVDISKNVLIQLYKTLWTRRNFWTSDLKNQSS